MDSSITKGTCVALWDTTAFPVMSHFAPSVCSRAQSLIRKEMRVSIKAKDEIKGTQSTLAGCVQNHNAVIQSQDMNPDVFEKHS